MYIILLIGLILRISFAFWGAKYYFGSLKYHDSDTWSFLNSFLNLIKYGTYTFDFSNIDAYIYRGPIYSFFLGMHYFLFGSENLFKYVAITQSALDTLNGFLIYKILIEFNIPKKYACIGSIIYLLNPIFITYSTIAIAETTSTTISLLILYNSITANDTKKFLLLGSLCAIGVMTRQHLGLLLPAVCLLLLINKKFLINQRLIYIFAIGMGFALTVSPWFLRNTINLGIPTFLMGKTSGYNDFQEDFIAADRFYNLYFVDVTPIIKSISTTGDDGIKDKKIFGDLIDEIRKANKSAYECGPSFILRRSYYQSNEENHSYKIQIECKEKVKKQFEELREKAINTNNNYFYWNVPIENLKKSFFKNELTKSNNNRAKHIIIGSIFSFRSVLMILGILSIFYIRQNTNIAILIFPISLIFYISVVMRHVEIRYYAQAESFLIILAIIFVYYLKISLTAQVKQELNSHHTKINK